MTRSLPLPVQRPASRTFWKRPAASEAPLICEIERLEALQTFFSAILDCGMRSFVTAFGLAAFFGGAALFSFLFWVVWRRRQRGRLETVLLVLLACLQLWFAGNFIATLLRQMALEKVAAVLGVVDAVAFSGLSLLPALLVHTHWLYYGREHRPDAWERITARIALAFLYLPLPALPWALAELFPATLVNPIQKLGFFSAPFLVMLAVAYYASALLQVRILQRSQNPIERALFSKLVLLFLLVPVFNFYVFSWGGSRQPGWGEFWILLALSSSLVPGFLITYYIYRHGFLQIVVEKGLSTLLLILLTLAVYLVGVRRLAVWMQEALEAPAPLVEGVFLGAVLLIFPTLSRWLQHSAGRIFSGRIRRYRQLAESLGRIPPRRLGPRLFREFIEETLRRELEAPLVKIHPPGPAPSGAGQMLPLETGERSVGWLEIDGPEGGAADREALRLLASEIAFLLERSQLLESRLRLEQEVARKSHLEELGRMAATVAHNVKNPLSSLKTLLQLMEEAHNLEPEQRSEVGMMVREVDRLSDTITKLLAFSRLESRPDLQRPAPVNLAHLLEGLQTVFRGDLSSRGIQLETRLETDDPVVLSDGDSLSDILGNLVANALDACRAGDRIRVSGRPDDAFLVLTVEDSGPGIPAELQERVFEPFVTTKSRGTGLGLAIVRRRVDNLGGEIRLSSGRDGSGAVFSIRFPLARP